MAKPIVKCFSKDYENQEFSMLGLGASVALGVGAFVGMGYVFGVGLSEIYYELNARFAGWEWMGDYYLNFSFGTFMSISVEIIYKNNNE